MTANICRTSETIFLMSDTVACRMSDTVCCRTASPDRDNVNSCRTTGLAYDGPLNYADVTELAAVGHSPEPRPVGAIGTP